MSKAKTKKKYSNEFLGSEELTETYWNTMNYFVGLIKASELKAGLILSFYGILINFVYLNFEKALLTLKHYWWLDTIILIWIVITSISIYHSVRCLVPRIMKKYEPNVFFFGDIISKFGDIKAYSKTFLDINVEKQQLFEQLGQQIYINAKITSAKFKNVNKSIRYLVYSLVILFIILFIQIILTLI